MKSGHYSTAYDLALITRYALKYNIFNEIIKSKTRIVTINDEKRELSNTNALLRTYAYADGGKTGYTDNAERCLICTATKNNMRLIAVVLGANSTELRFNTCKNILEECFNRYSLENIKDKLDLEIKIPVIKGEEKEYLLKVEKEDIIYPFEEGEKDKVYIKENIVDCLYGSDKKGKYLGRVQLIIKNEVIYSKDYFLEEDILKKSVKTYLKELVHILF